MRNNIYISISALLLIVSCSVKDSSKEFDAKQVLLKAYEVAGGDFWKRPQSLAMEGYGLFYKDDTVYKHEVHKMLRVYESSKDKAHAANGKVRIESIRDGKPVILLSYDGENTYDLNGKQPKSEADKRWASSFGFGVIRHALDEGYSVELMPDDTLRSHQIYQVKVIDPVGAETIFGINQTDHNIVKVAFDTPRGWHHRIYSNFFRKESYSWNQPGRVELYYSNKLSNEIIWKDFVVNTSIPDSLFVL